MDEVFARPDSQRDRTTIEALTDASLDAALLPPDRVGLPSSWWGHVPFAHWLVRELMPGLVVELGTHHGVSFSAFCNSVKHAGLPTKCFAIDTWRGDEQAGFYDEGVFANISASVQAKYSTFATLVRRTFDEALDLFADGSIDLLHIDGQHGYDAVKADYEAWHPKLSDRAVVLFHDTTIFERDFGVWRFWKELSARHPSFEFHHSCGLGVLAPGREVPDFMAALVGMEPAAAVLLRERLAVLGEHWITVDERTRAIVTIDTLNRAMQAADAVTAQLRAEAHSQGDALREARSTIDALRGEVDGARAQIAALAAAEVAERERVAAVGAEREAAHAQVVVAMRADRDAVHTELVAVSQLAAGLQAQIDQVRTSTSWRVMGPYRVMGRLVRRQLVRSPREVRQSPDFKRISRSGAFNAAFYLGRESPPEAEADVIAGYLAASQSGMPWRGQNPGLPQRRPTLGFHQLSYAAHCQDFDEAAGEDPLAHYLRARQPDGPWKHAVITAHRPATGAAASLRIVIHGHFHYPELLDDLLRRLAVNTLAADLFLTTTSEAKADEIRETLVRWDRVATVAVVPNRGRDIGALLMHFADLGGYDLLGHVHGKRSPQQSAARGDNWREFLWDHLIGDAYPMADVVAEAFAADERLGLIFPEDPNLNHWDQNHELAHAMAVRLQLRDTLPPHFEFPKGTMFWARPAALRPLVDLGWTWEDFPVEPIHSDGTVLHTLERMVPLAAAHAGFGFKAVHVPHSWRQPEE